MKFENKKFKQSTQKSKVFTLGLLFSLIVTCFTIGYDVHAANLSYSTIVEEGSMVEIPSYIIFRDGSTYYAKNGKTGAIDFSGTSSVIQSAFFAIPESSSGYIFFKAGKYSFDTKIVTSTGTHPAEGTPGNRNLKLIGEGGSGIDVTGTFTELEFTGTGTAIEVAPDSDFIMEGFRCVGGNPFLNFKDSGGGRGHIHRIAHCNFVDNTVAIKTGKSNPFMEIYRNRFRCTEKAIDWDWITDGNIDFNYFDNYPGCSNATIYVHADNGFLTIFRNVFLASGHAPDIKLECNNNGYIQIMLVEHNKFGIDGIHGSSQTERIKVLVAAGTSNPVVSGCSFSYNTIANSAGVNSTKHFISYSGTTVTFTRIKVNENIVLSGPNTGYLVDGGTSPNSIYNEAIGNIKQTSADFLKIVNGTTSYGGPQGFSIHHNQGYVTERGGTAEASNDDWISFGATFAGTPQTITLTVQESDSKYIAQVKASNSTHFQLYLWDLSAGAAETVDKTISWYAEYTP